jgi:hypothetical protein
LIQPQGVEIIPDRYIVVYKSASAAVSSSSGSISTAGVTVDHQFSSAINGFSASLSPEALNTLRQDPNIAFIEADQVAWLADDITITSVQTSTNWNLDRIDQRNLPLDGNYNYYQSGAGVNVYLMDSGINTAHPDLGGRATNDFDTVDGGMTDCNGHGTHVAGIIGSGTYGVAKAAAIHGVRITNCEGKGSVSSVIAAVDWITANHIKPAVVNLSYENGPSDAEDLSITKSIAAGITYVAAAGNDSGNACQYSPSRIQGVITVGATDVTDSVAGYSNQGSCLDIFAPGSDVVSTSMGGSSEIRTGTSMSAAHAAGAAALFLQSNPSASPADVANGLVTNSTKGALSGVNLDTPNRLLFSNPILPVVPSAPVLVKPSNGSIFNLIRPVFTWKISSTADKYTFQLAADQEFTSLIKEEEVNSLSYTLDSNLVDGPYYWRVRALNSNGDPAQGTWSDPFLFTVDTRGPAAPMLLSPLDDASPVGIPQFSWQAVPGAVGYQFIVDDTSDFSSPVATSPDGSVSGLPALTVTGYLPTGLLAEIPYYWRVRSRDSLGNWGDWSNTRIITIQAAIPASPVPINPAAGLSFKSNPTLTWNSVPGGVYYEVQIANNVQFTGTVIEDSKKPTGIFSHAISATLSDGIWYWRVRAFNSTRGAGNWSAVRSFIMDTTGPVAPILTSPLTDFTPLSVPVFSWQSPVDAKSFMFEIGTSTDGGKTITPLIKTTDGSVYGQAVIAAVSYKPASIPLETLCYWHVRAFDALGNPGNWSESRTIALQTSVPAAPVQVNPASGAAINALPTLTWNASATAETYEVQISNSTVFPSTSIFINAGTELKTISAGPLADGVWYWRVRGRNHTAGIGAWSAARTFIMDTQVPIAPVLVSPTSAVIRSTPLFSWKPVVTATGYQFEYGTASDTTIATFAPSYTSPLLLTVTHTPPAIPVGMFFWHVRACDTAGNWSAWSELRVINMNAPILAAPSLVSPVTGTSINVKMPTLAWKCAAGATGYLIGISDNAAFSGENSHMLGPALGKCTEDVPDTVITHDGIWYWRVATINQTYESGNYGTAGTFIFDDINPSAPVLVSPVDNSASLRAIPAFIWSPVSGANAYQFQIDDDGFTEPVLFTTPGEEFSGTPITVNYFIPANLKPGITYSWRVKARDAAQNWSEWSKVRSFTLLPAIPSAPIVVSPATGILTNDPLPKFTWNPVYSGESYRIQVDTTAVFTKPIINEQVSSGNLAYTPSSNISDGLYYWRVQAINANLESGAWSTLRTIIVDTLAPPAPKLLVPANNSNTLRATPVFSWAPVTGANAYKFQLDDESSFGEPLLTTPGESISGTPIIATSYTSPALSTLIPYYWRVKSRDAAGNWGAWSDSNTFTLLPLILTAPNPVSPAASFYTRTPPAFSWQPVTGAVDYELAVDDDSRFLTPYFSQKVGNIPTFTLPELPADGLYYWHVRAVNANKEPGSWSTVRAIIVDTAAPNPPDLLSPVNDPSGVRVIPFFYWSTPVGAKYYQFQMDDNNFADPEHIFFSTPGETVAGSPLTVTYVKPAGLSLLKTYHWRVRTADLAGNWSIWSSSRTFTLKPAIPVVPVVVSPVYGWITNNPKPVFTVKETAGIIRYEIELTPILPVGPKILFDSTTPSITYPSEKLADGYIMWRARMVNAANESGPWSASLIFTVDTKAPDAPLLTSPVNGSSNGRVIPVFSWGTVPGAKYYQFQQDDEDTFSDPVFTTPGDSIPGTPLTVTSYKPAVLNPLSVYFWHVRAIDAAGNIGNWSTTFNLSILPPIPGTPVLISPANPALTNNPKPEFRWNPVNGAAGYEIQISTSLSFTTSTILENVTTYIPDSNLDSQGKYFWRVRAINAKNEPGNWSVLSGFSMDTTAPDAPILSTPLNDALLLPGIPVFTWSAPAGAATYQFEYDDNADFGSPAFTSPDGSISGLAAIVVTGYKPPAMAPAVPFYWHVRARDAAGNWGSWSTARRISIQAPLPGTPVLSTPFEMAFSTNRTPVFSWSSAVNGYYYEVQVSNTSAFITLLKDEVTVSANQLTLSFADELPVGDLYWRVRALNVNGKPGSWSAVRKLTILAGYDFSTDSAGWINQTGGVWAVDSGSLSTSGSGVVNIVSNAVIDGYFSEFTYEARIRMGFDSFTPAGVVGNDHGLVLFGSDTLNARNEITNGLTFHIGQKMTGPGTGVGQFGIDLVFNGVKKPLTGTGYLSGPVNFNGWNALKVVSRGTNLTFFINNIQVYSVTNTLFKSGRLGVYSISHADPVQNFSVDWARVSAP